MTGRAVLVLSNPDVRKRAADWIADAPAGSRICGQCGDEFTKRPGYSRNYWSKQKYCSAECFGKAVAARFAGTRLPEADDFARWVDKAGDCWVWTGALDKDGYGIFSYLSKTHRAAKVALKLDGRPVPDGMYACHHCDNPACVRPDHLYPGTPTQNMADAISRNRVCRGEARSPLTAEMVREIRASTETNKTLRRRYKVSNATISNIRLRKTWGHLP